VWGIKWEIQARFLGCERYRGVMTHILGGMSIIVIGLVLGDSVFINKSPTIMGYVFDCLGLIFVGKGIYSMIKGPPAGAIDIQAQAPKEPPE